MYDFNSLATRPWSWLKLSPHRSLSSSYCYAGSISLLLRGIDQRRQKNKMLQLSLPCTRSVSLCSGKDHSLSLQTQTSLSCRSQPFLGFSQKQGSSGPSFRPLRFSIERQKILKERRGFKAVCYAAPLSPPNLQWVCTVSSAILLLAKGTAIPKSFLVPMFALQAPASIVSWIKGEYGLWTAFLALLVRLFFFIPGELELPLVALLLLIVAPYEAVGLRGTQGGNVLSLLIAGYLAYQHFSRAGSLQKAFDQGSIVATVAIFCATAVSFFLLI